MEIGLFMDTASFWWATWSSTIIIMVGVTNQVNDDGTPWDNRTVGQRQIMKGHLLIWRPVVYLVAYYGTELDSQQNSHCTNNVVDMVNIPHT